MVALRSGPLVAWSAAFFAGRVSIDQAVDAVTGADAPHHVGGLPDRGVGGADAGAPLRELLVAWRRAGGGVRLVLPVPGDVRGLPGPAAFRSAALDCGEAACGSGLGAVPEQIDYAPSSAPPTVLWHAFAIDPAPTDYVSVSDAQHELTSAIRETATALLAADVAGSVDDIADTLHDARRAGERLNLPPGFPARAVALAAQAERMHAVLELALADPIGGAVDRSGMAARSSALRPLTTAVRRARLAAYNADVRG